MISSSPTAPALENISDSAQKPTTSLTVSRIESIDLLRGIVIILMTLDHVRDYFHGDAFLFNPTNLDQTTPAIFATRWVTHFCAPVFVFLAGTSAFMVGQRKGTDALALFLLKRGSWLVFLEFTVMNMAWFFNVSFSLLVFQVIGALGVGMILLSFIIRLPHRAILVGAIIILAGHNLLDGVHVPGDGLPAILWSWIHEFQGFQIGEYTLLLGYPIVPWTGIMMLGFSFGKLYAPDFAPARRRKILMTTGLGMIAAFLMIRFINAYGDPVPWAMQKSFVYTAMSFINVTKYPPSLFYVLITLGPALIFLAATENKVVPFSKYILALGRAPMLFYILHVYWIHILAIVAALITGYEFSDMIFTTWVTDSPNLKGYGFGLPVVYVLWFFVVLTLMPICIAYDKYKRAYKEKWWLSYL
jgi:uncharacterized membrane protein